MYDNACCWTQASDEVGIEVLGWPAVSPNFDPIVHVWHYLQRRIRSRNIAGEMREMNYNTLC